jgi:hypothetical protein
MVISKRLSDVLKDVVGFKEGDHIVLNKRHLYVSRTGYRDVYYNDFLFGTIRQVNIDYYGPHDIFGIGGEYQISFGIFEETRTHGGKLCRTGRSYIFSMPLTCLEPIDVDNMKNFVEIHDYGDNKCIEINFSPEIYKSAGFYVDSGTSVCNFFKPHSIPKGMITLLRSRTFNTSIHLMRTDDIPNYMVPTPK